MGALERARLVFFVEVWEEGGESVWRFYSDAICLLFYSGVWW